MDWLTIVGSILGGIGIGQIAAQYLSARENKKERIFNKKEIAYLGLLEALNSFDMNPSMQKNYELLHRKILLVGSPDVVKSSLAIIGFGPIYPGSSEIEKRINQRQKIIDDLTEAMRIDLNIDKRKLPFPIPLTAIAAPNKRGAI